ncbi:MAG: DUF2924 domain-containing protein [Ramlibacter sp.]
MHSIDIDFEVFKKLTSLRDSEEVSYNDVLRRLLGMAEKTGSSNANSSEDAVAKQAWITKNVRFPEGTIFRSTYKGKPYSGKVEREGLIVDGQRYDSLSAAAVAITGSPVNGWRFWECKRPTDMQWALAETMRR